MRLFIIINFPRKPWSGSEMEMIIFQIIIIFKQLFVITKLWSCVLIVPYCMLTGLLLY